MEYKIEDLIPNALLKALEQEGKSLIHTEEGWITVDSASIQLSTTLPLVLEKLNAIYKEVRKDAQQHDTGDSGARF